MQAAYIPKPAATATAETAAVDPAAATTTPKKPRTPRRLPWVSDPSSATTPWTIARTPRSTRTKTAAAATPTTSRRRRSESATETDQSTTTTTMSTHTTPSRTPYSNRRRGGGGAGRGRGTPSSASKQKRGRFEDSQWFCDCADAQLPADRFKVRKDGPNKGRWFYTCQRKGEAGCGFFLWEEDAGPQMEGAVLGTGRGVGARRGFETGVATTAANGAAKRKFQEEADGEEPETEDEDDEDEYGWREDVGVEAAISRALDAMPPSMTSTPRKALKGREGATPGGSSMMTPVSGRKVAFDMTVTPTPTRSSKPATTPSSVNGDDAVGNTLVPEVFNLFKERGVNLDKETGDRLCELLKKYSLSMQGLAKGREISRLAVRERNAKNTELQARITALEAELETQKAVIANLNWQKETGQFD